MTNLGGNTGELIFPNSEKYLDLLRNGPSKCARAIPEDKQATKQNVRADELFKEI